MAEVGGVGATAFSSAHGHFLLPPPSVPGRRHRLARRRLGQRLRLQLPSCVRIFCLTGRSRMAVMMLTRREAAGRERQQMAASRSRPPSVPAVRERPLLGMDARVAQHN